MPYKKYLTTIYHCLFIISDSGTGQEEPCLLNTPVIVPRDYTERPQSFEGNCSVQFFVETPNTDKVLQWVDDYNNGVIIPDKSWLGNGTTSDLIIEYIRNFLSPSSCNISNLSPTEYQYTKPYPNAFIDNYLDDAFAIALQDEIMNIPESSFDRYDNPFEQKFTLRDKNNYPEKLNKLMTDFASNEFVEYLSKLTGYELINDSTKNFWGVHKYKSGDRLDIHVDAGIHPVTKQKKQVTIGLYLSKNWKEEYGCQLEIWDGENSKNNDAKLLNCAHKIAPLFNRLIIFTCDDYSWHGNPEPCNSPDDATRIFITISYLSNNTNFENQRQKAFFIARPNDLPDPEKDKLRLLRADPIRYAEIYRHNASCNANSK
jgi:Rps23 Pro-64 3,4-dihydroxylase Tpa1-like proline 4-hydroxylase